MLLVWVKRTGITTPIIITVWINCCCQNRISSLDWEQNDRTNKLLNLLNLLGGVSRINQILVFFPVKRNYAGYRAKKLKSPCRLPVLRAYRTSSKYTNKYCCNNTHKAIEIRTTYNTSLYPLHHHHHQLQHPSIIAFLLSRKS